MSEITLTSVSKSYPGNVPAVRDVSLSIPSGSFTVLVGPSGCGKSTTLRMIAGLEDLTSGSIAIGGRVVAGPGVNIHPKDRDIAMVFQNYALYPHMTVRQNLGFALKMRKTPRDQIESRVHAVAESLGLTELMDRKPGALSGGQRQRVAVGRAIVREPKAFLFDEPLSNLDARLRVSTRAELKALHQRLKTTTVHVTHDQEEAMTLGDQIVVMSRGLIQQIGAPLDVYRQPANRFVAGFIGTPAMNFLDGRIEGSTFIESAQGRDGLRVALPRSAGAPGPVVLGLRPQALAIATSAASTTPNTTRVTLNVSLVEPLGDQMDLACLSPLGSPLVARVPAQTNILPGSTVEFVIDSTRLHLFEPGEFGKAII